MIVYRTHTQSRYLKLIPANTMRLPIRVVKVPLTEREKPKPASFSPLGQLFLYHLENKDKIRESLVDKDEIPAPRYRPDPVPVSSSSTNKPKDDIADRLATVLGTQDPLQKPEHKTAAPTYRPVEKTSTSVEQREEREMKHELLHKFAILRRSYKGSPEIGSIPQFTEFSDYDEMRLAYDSAIRRLALDGSVDNYKTYLIMGFYLIEFGGTKFLKLPFSGFASEQIKGMNKYERLLVELGEKSYLQPDSNWPVELRLLGVLVMNAGLFLMTKMAMGALPSQLAGMMPGGSQPQPQRRRRMRGPSLNVDEIPDDKTKRE